MPAPIRRVKSADARDQRGIPASAAAEDYKQWQYGSSQAGARQHGGAAPRLDRRKSDYDQYAQYSQPQDSYAAAHARTDPYSPTSSNAHSQPYPQSEPGDQNRTDDVTQKIIAQLSPRKFGGDRSRASPAPEKERELYDRLFMFVRRRASKNSNDGDSSAAEEAALQHALARTHAASRPHMSSQQQGYDAAAQSQSSARQRQQQPTPQPEDEELPDSPISGRISPRSQYSDSQGRRTPSVGSRTNTRSLTPSSAQRKQQLDHDLRAARQHHQHQSPSPSPVTGSAPGPSSFVSRGQALLQAPAEDATWLTDPKSIDFDAIEGIPGCNFLSFIIVLYAFLSCC